MSLEREQPRPGILYNAASRSPTRLIVVCSADPTGRYEWLPAPRPADATVTLDGMAHTDLAARAPLLIDELQTWEQRSAAEHRISELLRAIREHPAVAHVELARHRLIDFAEYRLRPEIVRLLRGWTLVRAHAPGGELICDPSAPAALLMGARAAAGLESAAIPYSLPAALPGSQLKRALARPLMGVVGSCSRPTHVRVAAVAAGKLGLALASQPPAGLRAAHVGVMPFPGLDHGNGLQLALRARLPLLRTYGARRPGAAPDVSLPEQLDLGGPPALDRALTTLLSRVLTAAASELAEAVSAIAGLERARALRALLLPSAAYGASRLLIGWAHARGVRVGAIQHGIYIFRELDGGDRRADVILGWGSATAEQVQGWPRPHPAVVPVGVPGTPTPAQRPRATALRTALIATSDAMDTPIAPTAFCEEFIETLAPGLKRLAASGVALELRPHPNENPDRYQRLLRARGLDVRITSGGPFAVAAAEKDILISSVSSVAFEAAALGLPVLLWLGGSPQWVREAHLVAPWASSLPGTFEHPAQLDALIAALLEHPAEGFSVAYALSERLARFAEPFHPDRFATALRDLAA